MNNTYKIGLFLFIIILTSCEDFLKETPATFISTTNFYTSESDARTACDGVYKMLLDGSSNAIYGRWWLGIDLGTDDVTSKNLRSDFNNWFSHTINPTLAWFESYGQYSNFWTGIARANSVIANVPTINMDVAKRNAIVGEARALRAFYYYQLVRTYGDVPAIVKEVKVKSDFLLPRADVDTIYNQIIIPDLQFAELNCKDALHDGHITKWTAKIILAEVYLTRAGWRRTSQGQFIQGKSENWILARDKAKEIIDNSPHSLNTIAVINGQNTTPAYGVSWIESAPFSKESMLELSAINVYPYGSWITRECTPNANGSGFWGSNSNKPLSGQGITTPVSQLTFPGKPSVVGMYIPTADLWRSYETSDKRRDWGLMTKHTTPEGSIYLCQPTFRKYVDIDYYLGKANTSFQNTNNNFVIYRYADALLIYAEAANEVASAVAGDAAYNAVNSIRTRAGLTALTTGLSQNDFRIVVWKERRCEFAGECKRRFDLIRTKRLATETANIDVNWLPSDNQGFAISYSNVNSLFTGTVSWPDREWLMPIPQSEIELNGWIQNEGY
jgi:hypothetical protein